MLRAVESEPIAIRRRSSRSARCSASSSRRASGAPPSPRRSSTSRSRRARTRAVPIAVVPFGWQGAGAPAFDIAGVVSADLGSSGRFAPLATTRHGVAADAGGAGQFPGLAHARRRLPRDRHADEDAPDNFTATFQLFDVRARRVGDGLQAPERRAPICAKRRIASRT